MPNIPLHEFIAVNREEIIRRCRASVSRRSMPPPTESEMSYGVPLFLDQLVDALRLGLTSSPQIEKSAVLHGHERLLQGFTVSQVVQDYGDVCQTVTGLAMEMDAPIGTDDFRVLNRCLDDAIAGAVTEYGLGRNQSTLDGESARGGERLGFLALQAQHFTDTAIIAFEALKTGRIGVAGSTGVVLLKTLMSLRGLMARSLAQARLADVALNREPFLLSGFIHDVAASATLSAKAKHLELIVTPIEDGLGIEADRDVMAAVVGHLLQNAFKFTAPCSTVTLRVATSAERVLIEILDECAGLPDGDVNDLFRPFEALVPDSSVGLGLAFSRWGAEANNGRIYARSLPDKGCVFTIDLPRLTISLPSAVGPVADRELARRTVSARVA